jgi:predicted enzyme related to lactoylglutathione lyase
MLAFYRDYLGLSIDRELEQPAGHLWWLRCGGGIVKLVHLVDTPDTANPAGGMREATGFRFLTLVVSNVEEMTARAEESGARVLFTKKTDQLVMVMLEDPEGNQVELVDWL